MADEGGESVVSADLPDPESAWLAEQASARDLSEAEFLRRLVAAYRSVDDEEPDVATEADVAELAERVESVEADTEEKIEDVRDRIVQVKREVDAKAPADHDHPELKEGIRSAGAAAESAQSDVADLERNLQALRETTERGFDNYEEVLEYLTESTDDLEEKLTRVATALVGTRRVVGELGAREDDRQVVEDIQTDANRQGIGAADCENCGESVDLGLLADPFCPHCGTAVRGVEPKSGFFGSPTLLTGEPAALDDASVIDTESEVDTEAAVDALLEDDSLPGLAGGDDDADGDEGAADDTSRGDG
ncbi:MAG: hypothetical protein ABEH77_04165, partial [Halobacteriaceae archaeon]